MLHFGVSLCFGLICQKPETTVSSVPGRHWPIVSLTTFAWRVAVFLGGMHMAGEQDVFDVQDSYVKVSLTAFACGVLPFFLGGCTWRGNRTGSMYSTHT